MPEFTVAIHLDTEYETVQGLDIAFTYDPVIIQLDGIAPGYWFTGAVPTTTSGLFDDPLARDTSARRCWAPAEATTEPWRS